MESSHVRLGHCQFSHSTPLHSLIISLHCHLAVPLFPSIILLQHPGLTRIFVDKLQFRAPFQVFSSSTVMDNIFPILLSSTITDFIYMDIITSVKIYSSTFIFYLTQPACCILPNPRHSTLDNCFVYSRFLDATPPGLTAKIDGEDRWRRLKTDGFTYPFFQPHQSCSSQPTNLVSCLWAIAEVAAEHRLQRGERRLEEQELHQVEEHCHQMQGVVSEKGALTTFVFALKIIASSGSTCHPPRSQQLSTGHVPRLWGFYVFAFLLKRSGRLCTVYAVRD